MLSQSSIARAVFSLSLVVFCSVGGAHAEPGICLSRTPAPPQGVRNDGASSITFTWSIEHDTTCNQPYRLDILNPSLATVFSTTFACSPPSGSYPSVVPEGTPCGCYYGRLSFYSDWCNGSADKFEDQAWVGFLVRAAAAFRVCKRWDLNGDGNVTSDPPLQGWQFTVERPVGTVIAMGTTGLDGCISFTIDVECEGQTEVWIREVVQPGWVKTTPNGATNPFSRLLAPGSNPDILVGDWQPIRLTGYKLLDNAPWPWTSPHWQGSSGQENSPAYEPEPACPQPSPPAVCVSPFQPDQEFLANTYVCLYDNVDPLNPALIECTRTDANGFFSFGPLQWQQNWKITVPPLDEYGNKNPASVPPTCDTRPAEGGLTPWPGEYYCTVSSSAWPSPTIPCPNMDFVNCDELQFNIGEPEVGNQEYGCNYFWNRQPSRLWGLVCAETMRVSPGLTLLLDKDGFPYTTANINPHPTTGFYIVPEVAGHGPGIRSGEYKFTLPAPADPDNEYWEVTTYCDSIHGNTTYSLTAPPYETLPIGVAHSSDVRVDFCIKKPPERRQCFLPVTFTQEGWKMFCDPNNTVIPGGMVYNKFHYAFANFSYYSNTLANKVVIGLGKTITFEGTTSGLSRMCAFFPQVAACGKLDHSYLNPTSTPGGNLAGELLALQLNIAYNDMRLMPRTTGYDLEKFTLAKGLFKGKTVREVRNTANAVLGGTPPCNFGLSDCQALVDILARINENYEFFSFEVFNDRGYLIPNRALGQPDPPAAPVVP